jgi:creatinine amidohydrolase
VHPSWMRGKVYPWMTWEEVRDAATSGLPIVVPVGSTEQHGPQLPVCTDWVLPTEMARRAGEIRDLVVGPVVTFGYRSRPGSGGGQHFPGTVSLRATTFMAVVEDVLEELVRAGFACLVLYNWHFENVGFVYEAACLVSERHPDIKIVVIEDALPALSAEEAALLWPDGFPGLALEHAAVIETSLWLDLEPSAVRLDRMRADRPDRHPPYDVLPIDLSMTTASGSLSSPLGSSAAKGELLARRIVAHLVGILDAELGRPARPVALRSAVEGPPTLVGAPG